MSQRNKRKNDTERDYEYIEDYETDDDEPLHDDRTYFESSDDSFEDSSDEEYVHERSSDPTYDPDAVIEWTNIPTNYVPRKKIPTFKEPIISCDENSSEFQVFLSLFPKSLFMWISSCTNERLKLFEEEKNKTIPPTDYHEIMVVIGCTLMIAYNRVPRMAMYWSKNKSLRNEAIAAAISRDRFLRIVSKLYFNSPKKPDGAGKTYYMDELVSCLMYTFNRARSEATFQATDEAMIKFEGRSAMKQFMKDKPVDRGIKGWVQADSKKGYVYDFKIYSGKQKEKQKGKLGERVVNTLCSTIREPDVAIIVDRFFMSVNLQRTLSFPCVGTVISNRRNLPNLTGKLKRGESKAMCTDDGVICYKWSDTKEFLLMTNCHKHVIETAERKQKDGTKKTFDCPQAINFYNEFMGGVDRSDQYSTTYDTSSKKQQVVEACIPSIAYDCSFECLDFVQRINGKRHTVNRFFDTISGADNRNWESGAKHQRKANTGRPSKRSKLMINVGHQPVPGETMRRCRFCAIKKIQSRTKWLCNTCDVPLCVQCLFTITNENTWITGKKLKLSD